MKILIQNKKEIIDVEPEELFIEGETIYIVAGVIKSENKEVEKVRGKVVARYHIDITKYILKDILLTYAEGKKVYIMPDAIKAYKDFKEAIQ